MTASAYESIRRAAMRRIELDRLDPVDNRSEVVSVVASAVADYQAGAHETGQGRSLRDPADMSLRVLRSISAHGALTELFERPAVEEIFIEGDVVTYLDEDGRLLTLGIPTSSEENRHVVGLLLSATDRRLDTSHPIVQARVLGDSARLTAVIPPIADALSATIRRFAMRRETLDHLVAAGSLTSAAGGFLWAAMQAGASVLVSGPPGAGKTTMLAALLAAEPPTRCVRCVEEVRELHVPLSPHSSFYETRPGSDGRTEVSLRDLVKLVLAMRPDRIVVGEVRGAEAFELTRASNAGCGFSCTVHANSARDALHAIVNAALMAGENVTERVVRRVFASTIEIVVHLGRDSSSVQSGRLRRETLEILAVAPSLSDDFTSNHIFSRERLGAPLRWTGHLPNEALTRRLQAVVPDGVELSAVCDGRVSLL